MLNKRISKRVVKKVIAGVLIFCITILGFGYQHKKINTLETELYQKQRVEERMSDVTTTEYDKDSIQMKFNEIQEYKIFNSTISVKHSYQFDEESILGMHRKATLTGTCNVYFEYHISLSDSFIHETDDSIQIILNNVYLDRETVHIENNSFIKIDDESSTNVLAGYKTGEKVMSYWNESLIDKSYDYIEEYYNDSAKVRAYACRELKDLVETITDKKVEIIFKSGD